MKNTFILYIFNIIRLYIFNNIFDQTLSSLTLTKPRMQDKNGQREYKSKILINTDKGDFFKYSLFNFQKDCMVFRIYRNNTPSSGP
jgi:hypothetical protein